MFNLKKLISCGLAVACCAVASSPSFLMAQTSLDTTNFTVDITEYVGLAAVAFSSLVTAVLGVYVLIQIVKGGMSWIRRYATK